MPYGLKQFVPNRRGINMDTTNYKKHEPFFGSWYISKMLGEGSFGKVFEIERQDFGETYKAALKVITVPQNESEVKSIMSSGMDQASVTEYFEGVVKDTVSEFVQMSKLKGNSNIVSYEDHQVIPHEGGKVGWDILIRMELLTPLLDYAQDSPLKRYDVIKLGIDMCHALELCQKHNIIHRDIKPENIFISENGNFKLGDFGIARTIEKTSSGLSKKGTHTYMAPEVYKGEEYGSSVDIYSLGIVMYRLLNENRTPFLPPYPEKIKHSDVDDALIRRISGQKIVAPLGAVGRLAEIVLKACAYNSAERYSSPMQMRAELEAIMYGTDEAKVIYPQGDEVKVGQNEYETADEESVSEYTYRDEGTVSVFGGDSQKDAAELNPKKPEYREQAISEKVELVHEYKAEINTPVQPTPPESKTKFPWVATILLFLIGFWAVSMCNAHHEHNRSQTNDNNNAHAQVQSTAPDAIATAQGTQLSTYVIIQGREVCTSLTALRLFYPLSNEDLVLLRYMTNLTSLELSRVWVGQQNAFNDLTPLSELINLTSLTLIASQVSDLTPISSLTNLETLWILESTISDISSISSLTNLETLQISRSTVSDLSPLSNLTNLEWLILESNQISDITPLTSLTNLRRLALGYNQITDLTPLSNLTNLERLILESNQISDITPLTSLTNLRSLALGYNQITDLTPLSNLKNLDTAGGYLDVGMNPIYDWTPISHVTRVWGRP